MNGTSLSRLRGCWPIPGVLAVHADSPWKSVADLVADAKKRPGQITYSSSGNYGASHVPFEMFSQAAGIKMLHVAVSRRRPRR